VYAQKSTIVRAVQPIFKVLERAAPGVGSVIAERFWCAIPQGKPMTAGAAGDVFKVRFQAREVVAEAWGEGPVVYLMHGWGGRRAQLDALVEPLLWAGHRVITFDAPGHGESEPGAFGKGQGLLTEFAGALEAVSAVGGQAHAVIAHSLGAAAASLAILDGWKVDRVVLVAPMADPIPYTYEFAAALGFGERIRTGFLRRLERRVGRPMSDFEIPRRLKATSRSLPAALVVHDRLDKEVHFSDGETLAGAWPAAEFVATEGLGHRRILRDPAVIERVVAQVAGVRV
jgi:alpha-beta hydrolase superfamily lysophospholipase